MSSHLAKYFKANTEDELVQNGETISSTVLTLITKDNIYIESGVNLLVQKVTQGLIDLYTADQEFVDEEDQEPVEEGEKFMYLTDSMNRCVEESFIDPNSMNVTNKIY